MNTIFIYNQGIETPLTYFVLEGDYLHLHGTFIGYNDSEDLVEELSNILDYDEWGVTKVTMLDTFPVDLVTPDTKVIEVGFVP
jgi:hypothetical protein